MFPELDTKEIGKMICKQVMESTILQVVIDMMGNGAEIIKTVLVKCQKAKFSGIYYFSNGDLYNGEFKDDKKCGHGNLNQKY